MRVWLTVAAVLGSLATQVRPVDAADLFVDPWRTPELLRQVTADPSQLHGFRRLYLLVFSNGQTLYPTRVEPFSQAPAYVGKNVLSECAAACRASGVSLWWVAELLRWSRDDVPGSSIRMKAAGCLEMGIDGRCTSAQDLSAYASPCDPKVQDTLPALTDEMAGLEPAPRGLLLCCRLSPQQVVGYSETSRAAFIRAEARDPVDLDVMNANEVAPWAAAREEQVAAILRRAVEAARRRRPELRFAAWASGNYAQMVSVLRVRVADNWIRWMQDGLVSEAVLIAPWGAPGYDRVWDVLRRMEAEAKKAPPPSDPNEPPLGAAAPPKKGPILGLPDLMARIRPLVPTRDAAGNAYLEKQMESLRRQNALADGAVFWPVSGDDWEDVRRVAAASTAVSDGAPRQSGEDVSRATASPGVPADLDPARWR